ncbi:putative O-antigen ligase domain-containing protein [Candidatus Magnetomoraceae bacterium gMMP-15]
MNETDIIFLYEPNIFFEWGLLILLLIFLVAPKYLVGLVVMLTFLRPNERFDLPLSYPTIMYPLLLISLLMNYKKIDESTFGKEDKILGIYVAFILVQSIVFHRENFKTHLMSCGLGLIYYYSIIIHLSDRRGLKLLNYALVISCFLICLEPLYYHYTVVEESEIWYIFHGNGRLRAWGLWKNANETSFIACIGIANILLLLLTERNKLRYIIMFSPLLIMFALVICLTASRAGLACLSLIFIVLVLTSKSKALKLMIIILMVGAIFLAPRFVAERADQEGSSSERFDLRYHGRQIFLENFFLGVGFGRAKSETGGMALHCTYIQAFAETGIFGGSMLLYSIYLIVKRIYKNFKFNKDKGDNEITTIYGGIAGICLCGLFYLYFGNQLLSNMFFTFIALIKISSYIKRMDRVVNIAFENRNTSSTTS